MSHLPSTIINTIDDIISYEPDYCASPREISFMIAAENFMIHHLENVQYCEIFHHKLDAMMTDEITPFNHQQFINEVIDYHLSEHANLNDEIMKLYKI